MHLSDISDLESLPPRRSPQLIRFIQDEEGTRKGEPVDALPDQDDVKERGIKIIWCVGHIGHFQDELLHTLAMHPNHDLGAEIFLVEANSSSLPGYPGPQTLEQKLQELSQIPTLITRITSEDLGHLFLEKHPQPHQSKHVRNHHRHLSPKTQPKAMSSRKYSQRKK